MTKTEQIALALISAAAWLIQHEDEDWGVGVNRYKGTVTISCWVYVGYEYPDGEEIEIPAVDRLAAIRKSLGGKWEKNMDDYELSLSQEVAPNVTVKLSISRSEACEPKVIGTETVEVIDYDQPQPMKTITRDIIEYDCKPILGMSDSEMLRRETFK